MENTANTSRWRFYTKIVANIDIVFFVFGQLFVLGLAAKLFIGGTPNSTKYAYILILVAFPLTTLPAFVAVNLSNSLASLVDHDGGKPTLEATKITLGKAVNWRTFSILLLISCITGGLVLGHNLMIGIFIVTRGLAIYVVNNFIRELEKETERNPNLTSTCKNNSF